MFVVLCLYIGMYREVYMFIYNIWICREREREFIIINNKVLKKIYFIGGEF